MKSFAIILKSIALSLLLATGAHAADKVNINTADAATLDAVLVNVGPSKAQAIVDYRSKHGPFKSLDDLKNVKGFGEKSIAKLKSELSISGGPEAAKK